MKKIMGELELIEQIRSSGGASLRGRVALGIGDDCAILRPPKAHEIVVTTDFTLEGRHFRRGWHTPESVGHRALARGLSDIAAMGARPLAAFLSLALPADMLATRAGQRWVKRFFVGLRALGDAHDVPLAGGDTAESPTGLVLADIVLIGSAPAGRALKRSGGRAGDLLYVTGALGGAGAELIRLQQRKSGRRLPLGTPGKVGAHPQMYPEPRVEVGQVLLRRHLATAAIDLSDGLSTDLSHLCQESGVGAEIFEDAIPLHPLATKSPRGRDDAIRLALDGGEDYELLFAAPASVKMPSRLGGVPITLIGRLVRGKSVSIVGPSGRSCLLKPGGWEHFSARSKR
jgi:thiamine-monophosphate kinase